MQSEPVAIDSISPTSKGHLDELLDLRIADPAELSTAQFVVLAREHQIAKEAALLGKLSAASKSHDFGFFFDYDQANTQKKFSEQETIRVPSTFFGLEDF